MNQTAFRSHCDWRGARVAVVGLARSGLAACHFLKRLGARVVATDRRSASDLGATLNSIRDEGIEVSLETCPDLREFDAIVLSPGVDPLQDMIVSARDAGVRVIPELELGASEAKGRIVCVTGTKGKSTTTMSLHAMLLEGGFDSRAVGNIGEPITAHVDGSDERSIFVTEASSFQLETTQEFRPHCALFLNLFPDHLDRHPSFAAYAQAKARIFANQTKEDTAIVNADDPAVLDLSSQTRARVIHFRPRTTTNSPPLSREARFEDGQAVVRDPAPKTLFIGTDVAIPGSAVRANLLAAATAAHHLGVPGETIRQAVRKFRGVPHTFERLGEVSGVAFFNDSKATTPESVGVALESFESPVIAIMGGRLKAGSFQSLKETVAKHVRSVYAIGESRGLISEAFASVCPVHESNHLEEAVLSAYQEARPGDTVLLSPGCASFDMFADYAERGNVFRRAFERISLKGAA